MINILLSGSSGAMGKVLQEMIANENDLNIAAGFNFEEDITAPFKIYTDLSKCAEDIDVIIDFSHHSAFDAIFKFALDKKIPLVMATTGLSPENEQSLVEAAKTIPIFRTSNMSIGINVLLDLISQAAVKLEGFDIELIEKHHNKKQDSPSGTAFMFANEINNALNNALTFTYGREGNAAKRETDELGIHAIRGGTIAGEHSVIYAGEDEIIEIKHTATSKRVFAKGAIRAARYIANKESGLYDMRKVLNAG